MTIKTINKLPRLITIPGLEKKEYRLLQSGKAVEVSGDIGQHLISYGFVEIVKETKAKAEKGGDK